MQVAFADCWDNVTVGMKVEVENRDCEKFKHIFASFYWIATVVKIAGELFCSPLSGKGGEALLKTVRSGAECKIRL